MVQTTKYHIGIEIDKLTNSILNTISGDSFPTDIIQITKADLKKLQVKTDGFLIGQMSLIVMTVMFTN